MRSAFALRIFSGKIILIFRVWSDRVCAAMKAPVGLSSGRAVCVSRWKGFALTSSAERSKRFFHKWGRRGKQHLQSESAILSLRLLSVKMQIRTARVCAAMKAPVGLSSGRAVCVSRWRGFAPTSSAGCPNLLYKNFFPLSMRKANAARIPNHPPPSCNFGAKGVEYSHNQIQGSS